MATLVLAGVVALAIAGGAGDGARPPDDVGETYAGLKAATPRDAEAQAKLALWCEAHGLTTERLRHLALAILADPQHGLARALLGQVNDAGAWRRPEDVIARAADDPERAATLAEYRRRRSEIRESADDHAKLAAWCESAGLADEARAHYRTTVRIDPRRESAWKKLGCKKVNGRWVAESEIEADKAQSVAQREASSLWGPKLERWKDEIRGKNPEKRSAALAALAEVTDPMAAPEVVRVFLKGGEADPLRGVQLLGQIDSAPASNILTLLAIDHPMPEVRGQAAQTLRHRDPREFAGLLIERIQDPVKYEVRPVNGPGSPGVLLVEGQRFDTKRVYLAPTPPPIIPGPGDIVSYDENGFPVLTGAYTTMVGPTTRRITAQRLLESMPYLEFGGDPAALGVSNNPTVLATQRQFDHIARKPRTTVSAGLSGQIAQVRAKEGLRPEQFGFVGRTSQVVTYQVRAAEMFADAQRAAFFSQLQLSADVSSIEAHNAGIRVANDQITDILKVVSGQDHKADRKAWRSWWIDQLGYSVSYGSPGTPSKPVVVQPIAPPGGFITPRPVVLDVSTSVSWQRMSCFAAGTLVHTAEGLRPIEALEVGDRVLGQDPKSGELSYKPVLVVHRNPPARTFRVQAAGETVTASEFHRFWAPGRGWVMARDLKSGDTLRTLGGPASVESVEAGEVLPVFNLDVADVASFFVGRSGALVHDNTLPDLRARPFDAPAEVAVINKRSDAD